MNFLARIILFFKKPRVVILNNNKTAEVVLRLLSKYSDVGKNDLELPGFFEILKKEIFILNPKINGLTFFFKNSKKLILIVENTDEIKETTKLIKMLPVETYLVLNYDEAEIRNLKKETVSNVMTFGFWEGADLQATDIQIKEGLINFKLNYHGGFVPIWIKLPTETKTEQEIEAMGKEIVYPVLASASAGIIIGLNLVEISQGLK